MRDPVSITKVESDPVRHPTSKSVLQMHAPHTHVHAHTSMCIYIGKQTQTKNQLKIRIV